MKKVAKKFGLTYSLGDGIFSFSSKRNILKGKIKGHRVEIYDISIIYRRSCTRHTFINLDNRKRKYTGKVSGYYPVKEIIKILDNLT
ncbi:MAG: hypothetical protein GF390_00490 [Candidatus Pacebacteria bacterium]|nr:hypothetical protein [Candidatus Paceibacterota bacterium]